MSDPKDTKKDDIVASDDATPETLEDQDLDQADGGWSWSSHPTRGVQTKTFSMSVDAETITASASKDTITTDAKMLRTRPGRIGNF